MTDELMTDDELEARTRNLLSAAEAISYQLTLQTERLAAAIELFDQEIIIPLRQELGSNDTGEA